MKDSEKALSELLAKLERREAALLEWGFFDVVHTSEEIVDLFANDAEWGFAFQELANGSEELFVDNLAECNLLHRVSRETPRKYRSRFAESLRLMARLKQRFKENDWPHAPELVSQVKLHLAPRRFPIRDHTVEQVWQVVSSSAWSHSLQRKVLDVLMGGEGPLKLAAFQVRAIARILSNYRGTDFPTGTVVTAGTGGGKTKSFYIPALMGIAADVARDNRAATRVLALYPRNVLLADQFAEASFQAETINRAGLLQRPIRVGALTGDVPYSSDFENFPPNKWALSNWKSAKFQKGRLLPHLRHPSTGERLVWTDADRLSGKSVLRRDTSNGEVVFDEGTVCLTRNELIKRPPDVFLTSVEMLNKELSSELGRGVLGLGLLSSPLRMVLMDEIHTYEGITGAQVPWILRRLAYWSRPLKKDRQIHYVGLSATLHEASEHLATLTGVSPMRIEEIAPQISLGELSIEGQEYNVVLKSHPGSGAGVLSTSIQSAMLGARLLTPKGYQAQPRSVLDSALFYGRKAFCFTDNLDVVNRWLPDLKNAEQTLRLARLRQSQPNDELMDAVGQVWKLPIALGHNLETRLDIDRISSQDPGIDSRADIVLATSSLEVGYDDPDVGMVLQHKAPRSAASFLQRKGRAGRRQGMRPWTVVVLSDHGRDRWAFRDSEQLFSPLLSRLSLPVSNPYLLRIQATWFLVDWIAFKIGKSSPGLYLTRENYRESSAEQIIEQLLNNAGLREEFTQALTIWLGGRSGGRLIGDPAEMARGLMWSPPRAVLRHVVPDLRKSINAGYPIAGRRPRLLPKFLPSSTWDVLDTQDVELHLDDTKSELLDASKALYETVPGRVSRRFVVNPRDPSKWPTFSAQLLTTPVKSSVRVDELFNAWVKNDELISVNLFQPTDVTFSDVPPEVKNSSNAQWEWELMIRQIGQSGFIGIHSKGLMARLFGDSRTWLHRDQCPIQTYWFSRQCRYEIHLSKDQVRRGVLEIMPPMDFDGVPASSAIGYSRSVDALELVFNSGLLRTIPLFEDSTLQEMKVDYFRHRAAKSPLLNSYASHFAISSLCSSTIGMLIATALRHYVDLEKAWGIIPDKAKAATKVMRSILSVEGDESDNRRLTELKDLWQNQEVYTEISSLVSILWSPLTDEFNEWLRLRFIETVRAGIEEAIRAILPEASDNALTVEVVNKDGLTSVWILETDSGGVGVIERLLRVISSDPEQFERAFEWSISVCPSEETRTTILEAVQFARDPYSELRGVFNDIRSATDYRTLEDARKSLISAMERQNLPVGKRHITSLLSKVLSPGTNVETERWLIGLSRLRTRVVNRIGAAVDARSFAYWLTTVDHPRNRMKATLRRIFSAEPNDTQVYQAFMRLTVEPCSDSCPECLGISKDAQGLSPSRRLVSLWLGPNSIHTINVDSGTNWISELLMALRNHSRIRLCHHTDQRNNVAENIATLLTREIDRGFHSTSIRVVSVRARYGWWETDVEIDTWGEH